MRGSGLGAVIEEELEGLVAVDEGGAPKCCVSKPLERVGSNLTREKLTRVVIRRVNDAVYDHALNLILVTRPMSAFLRE